MNNAFVVNRLGVEAEQSSWSVYSTTM